MNADGIVVRLRRGLLVVLFYYDGIVVGEYVADLLVEGRILVELKAMKNMGDKEVAQCLNYIKATRLNLCLLINFGNPKVEVKRVVKNF